MKKTIFIFWLIFVNLGFGQLPNKISNEDKVYELSKFWQEVNYNFIYLYKIDQLKWENQYKELIGAVQKTKNDYEYYRLLQKFCATLKDGHTNIWFPKYIQDNILTTDFGNYRLILSNIEGKAIITRINRSKSNEIPIGTEIIEVNGIDTNTYLKDNVFPYISSSTNYVREDIGIENMLEGYIGTTYNLKIRLPNGDIKTLKLTLNKSKETMFPPIKKRKLLDFEWVEKDIAYVALNSFSSWKITLLFKEKLPELKKAKKLIIDLRYNGGGNTTIGKVIFHHLTNDTILYGTKAQSRMYIPTFKVENRNKYFYDFPYKPDTLGVGDRRLLKNNRVVIPTVILIGHKTGSAAEDFLIYAANQNHITKIGTRTNGSTGQPMIIYFPSGGVGRICTRKDTYPDGREFVGYGIKPAIEIKKTLADYINDKDPALETAINYLKDK